MQPSNTPSTQPSGQPTNFPSNAPSGQPSIAPVPYPSAQPTSNPSPKPSPKKTDKPSPSPTLNPTVKAGNPTPQPTLKPTFYPTSSPTSSPSIDYTRWNETKVYDLYQEQMGRSAVEFGTFTFKSVAMDTKCNDFEYFIDNGLTLPYETMRISSISLTIGTDNPDINSDISMNSSLSAICSEQNNVDYLIDALQNRKRAYANCNGNHWRVFQCSNKITLCVNCRDRECNICPATPNRLSINPCNSFKPCLALSTGFSFVGFNISKKILYPRIDYSSRKIMNISKNSITFSQNVSKEGIVHCGVTRSGAVPISIYYIKSKGVTTVLSEGDSLSLLVAINDLIPDTSYNTYCYTEGLLYNYL
jgi:hypothetical protein